MNVEAHQIDTHRYQMGPKASQALSALSAEVGVGESRAISASTTLTRVDERVVELTLCRPAEQWWAPAKMVFAVFSGEGGQWWPLFCQDGGQWIRALTVVDAEITDVCCADARELRSFGEIWIPSLMTHRGDPRYSNLEKCP